MLDRAREGQAAVLSEFGQAADSAWPSRRHVTVSSVLRGRRADSPLRSASLRFWLLSGPVQLRGEVQPLGIFVGVADAFVDDALGGDAEPRVAEL